MGHQPVGEAVVTGLNGDLSVVQPVPNLAREKNNKSILDLKMRRLENRWVTTSFPLSDEQNDGIDKELKYSKCWCFFSVLYLNSWY